MRRKWIHLVNEVKITGAHFLVSAHLIKHKCSYHLYILIAKIAFIEYTCLVNMLLLSIKCLSLNTHAHTLSLPLPTLAPLNLRCVHILTRYYQK